MIKRFAEIALILLLVGCQSVTSEIATTLMPANLSQIIAFSDPDLVMLPAYKAGHPSKVDYNFDSCHSSPLTKRGMLSAPRQRDPLFTAKRVEVCQVQDGGLSKKSIDCSGFVYLTYLSEFGIKLPRTAVE